MLSADKYVKQIDPTIDLGRPVKIKIEEGAEAVTQTKYPASSSSLQNIQFNSVNPPSAETVVDRKIYVKAAFRLTFTGNNVPVGQYLLQTNGINISGQATGAYQGGLAGGVDGLRAFPLSQMLNSLVLKMNSKTFTQNINEYIEPLMRYSNHRNVGEEDWSMTPTMQDQYQQYSDFTVYGSAKNSLGNYGESQFRVGRGGFASLQVVDQYEQGSPSGTASTGLGVNQISIVDFEVTEPLFISPLAFGKRFHRGFIGLTTMSVTLNIDSQYFNRVWSHNETSSGKTITNIGLGYNVSTPGFVAQPEIMFTYYTPRYASMKIPKENLYPYHSITDYTDEINATVLPGSETAITVANYQLDSVPKRVYFYLRERNSDKTFNDTDTYARIKSINITFANVSGILSDANEQQLYELSVDNGLKCSWSEWSRHVGSVLCVDFARNISTINKAVVGKNMSCNFMYKITVQNLSNSAKQYTAHTVVVSDGYLKIEDRTVESNNNLGDIDKYYDSDLIREIDWEEFENFYGSGFADKLKNLAKKAAPIAKKVIKKGADEALKAAKKYGPGVANLALSEIPVVGPELGQVAEVALRSLANGEIGINEYKNIMEGAYDSCGMGVVERGGKIAGKRTMKKRLNRY